MNKANGKAISYGILAAVFYAISIPAAKILLNRVEPIMMAAILYLGAGIGVGLTFLILKK